VDGHTTLGK